MDQGTAIVINQGTGGPALRGIRFNDRQRLAQSLGTSKKPSADASSLTNNNSSSTNYTSTPPTPPSSTNSTSNPAPQAPSSSSRYHISCARPQRKSSPKRHIPLPSRKKTPCAKQPRLSPPSQSCLEKIDGFSAKRSLACSMRAFLPTLISFWTKTCSGARMRSVDRSRSIIIS
jgi:hypothetical protein